MKILKKIIIGFFILIILVSGTVYFYLKSKSPKYDGKFDIAGLKNNVEIYFDQYGVPHIYAENMNDLYFAFGYVHAQERLFQMEMLRRIGSGRLSEILGQDFVKTDKFFRTIGLKETAQKSAKAFRSDTSSQEYKNVKAYLQGVNEFIKTGKTPVEFDIIGIPKTEFVDEDLFMIAGYLAFSFAAGFKQDPLVTEIQQKLGEQYLQDLGCLHVNGTCKIPVYKNTKNDTSSISNIAKETAQIMNNLPVPFLYGSNSWIINGSRTKSGKVIFANDTHIGFSQPAVWYEAHLICNNFELYGNFMAGIPFALVGHSKHHAWGLTMFENDDVDFFYEDINSKNKYNCNGQYIDLQIIKETIKVKNANDVNFEIKKTATGPIMNDVINAGKNPVTLYWTYTKTESQLLKAFWNLNNSQNINDSRQAAALISAPGLNVMYADSAGNIAWWASAKITKYKQNINTYIINSLDSLYNVFDGYYDISENPSSENPPSGYVYSANNQPQEVNNILYSGYYAPEARARRINFILNRNDDWTVEKMKTMSADVISMSAVDFAREILKNTDNNSINKSELHKKAYAKLMEWNGEHNLNSVEPVIYYRLIRKITEAAMSDEVPEKENFELLISGHFMQNTLHRLLFNNNSVWWDNINTKNIKETRKQIFSKAFNQAVTALSNELGNDINKWNWYKVHTLEHEHLIGKKKPFDKFFNVGPFGVFGGTETLNNLNFHLSENGIYKVYYGPAMRIIIDFADIENSVSVLPTGQSGNFMSKHYDNQAEMYNSGKFRKQMMNRNEIVSLCKDKLILF